MPKPSVLILESDAASEQRLHAVLGSAGYEVYSAARVDALLEAVRKTSFSVVLVDLAQVGVEPASLASMILQHRPHIRLIFSGPELPFDRLLALLRAGAADYFARPYDAVEVVARIRDNVQRLSTLRRTRTDTNSAGFLAVPSMAPAGPDTAQVVAFARQAIQAFVELQQQTVDLRRQVMEHDPRMAERLNRPVTAWIAHADDNFVRPMVNVAPRFDLEVTAVLTTGGEILDRLSAVRPQVLLIGDSLPDIPSEMIVETIMSQAPEVNVIVIEGWETGNRSGVLRSGAEPTPVHRRLAVLDDLAHLVRRAADRARNALITREVTEEFRSRNADFVRAYSELMNACGERP